MKLWGKLSKATLALMLTGAMVACSGNNGNAPASEGSGNKPAEKVELTMLTHYVGVNETQLKPLIEQWNSENPDIQIKPIGVDFGELQKTIMTKQSAGQGADIMHVYALWGGQLNKNNVLAEAPDHIAEDVKANYPEAAVKGASLDGKVFGYPTEVQAYGLFYNKRLLKEAGFDNPPATWDEMLSMAKAIEKKDSSGKVQVQGFGFQRGYAGLVDQPFMAMMAAAGSNLLSDDLTKSNLNTDAGKKTLELYSKVYGKDGMTDISFNATKGFGTGQVAMTIGAGWWAGSLKTVMKDSYTDVGVAPIPSLDGSSKGTIAYTWAWGVNSKSKNQEAAWKFLQWMNSTVVKDDLTPEGSFLLEAFNTASSRKSDLESPKLKEHLGSDPIIKNFSDALTYASEEQSPATAAEVQDILFKNIESMWTGQQSLDDTINNAHTQIEEKLK
ncbi:ABC transporter substrate-binding protein [Paenibacillus mendelii]|uniref:ABC transporter substrate-binding protein n=1 Tax=Paenibacillus mendelii TaxID=206163 RepID=A0ABV6JCK1_9BACL|nr:ABC transporter substrate-binding protein [Paenibacillus mendelii]MCQ6561630.1 ABC transporter substrate-binding protein [Paenibacillus mendelii]